MTQPLSRIQLLSVAESDLSDILTYIAANNKIAAATLLERFETSLASLASNPNLGRVPDEEALASLGYRYLVVSNYLIFYIVRPGFVVIHRIVHGARDYQDLL